MCDRLITLLTSTIPELDVEDIFLTENRQSAPEYTHHAYQFMLSQESVVGNYLKDGG